VPDEIPQLLDRFKDYVNPASQLRLMRLRGRQHSGDWEQVHEMPEWKQARRLVAALAARPKLELEG
jgi:hypothetical protein